MQAVALIHFAERHGRRADLLENDRDRTRLAVEVRDRQRDALAVLAHAQDDELTRLGLARYMRRIDHHQLGVRVERLLFQNLIHVSLLIDPWESICSNLPASRRASNIR